jgi:nucleotide-binding universal stress UspA family protein
MKTTIETALPLPQTGASRVSTRDVNLAEREQALQIKIILVPLDFSRASMQALKHTIPLAEEFKAAIHLVHVQPTDELTAISRAGHLMLNCADAIALMQDRLAEVQEKHDVRFWPDNCHVVSGRPFEEICKLAREIEADLIVLPTRGHGGLKHVVLGSTAERVVRYAPCPVLVPRGARYESSLLDNAVDSLAFKLGKILVPVDFSRCSLAGVKYAAGLARRTGASLRLLHVVFPYTQVLGMDRVGADVPPLIETAAAAAREELSALAQMNFLRGVPCETEVRSGSAIDVICGETGQPDIDLVVTSTHGRAGFKRALLGSVAEHVMRYAECPVIIVPSRAAANR